MILSGILHTSLGGFTVIRGVALPLKSQPAIYIGEATSGGKWRPPQFIARDGAVGERIGQTVSLRQFAMGRC